jgi:hypothetical protein
VPALISHYDGTGHLRFANAEVGRVFHSDPDSLVGKTLEEVRGIENAAQMRPFVDRVLHVPYGDPTGF